MAHPRVWHNCLSGDACAGPRFSRCSRSPWSLWPPVWRASRPALRRPRRSASPVVVVGAEVRPNGDLRVRETRVLSFSGQFSFVYWDLSSQRFGRDRDHRRKRARDGRHRVGAVHAGRGRLLQYPRHVLGRGLGRPSARRAPLQGGRHIGAVPDRLRRPRRRQALGGYRRAVLAVRRRRGPDPQ